MVSRNWHKLRFLLVVYVTGDLSWCDLCTAMYPLPLTKRDSPLQKIRSVECLIQFCSIFLIDLLSFKKFLYSSVFMHDYCVGRPTFYQVTHHTIILALNHLAVHAMNAWCARACVCVYACGVPMPFPQSHPPTGTIASPYPIKTIAKTGIQTSARARVCMCVCAYACSRAPHIRTNAHKFRAHTAQRESNFKIKPLEIKKGGGGRVGKTRMRASEPPPVLADCKGLSVTAAFFWAKGKQQDSAWGPIKDYSSWKTASHMDLNTLRC